MGKCTPTDDGKFLLTGIEGPGHGGVLNDAMRFAGHAQFYPADNLLLDAAGLEQVRSALERFYKDQIEVIDQGKDEHKQAEANVLVAGYLLYVLSPPYDK